MKEMLAFRARPKYFVLHKDFDNFRRYTGTTTQDWSPFVENLLKVNALDTKLMM